MSELGVYDSQGEHVAGRDFKNGGKMAKEGFFEGLKFYADVEGPKVKYHCFFRGRESSSGRAEQYFLEYSGDIKSFRGLADEVKKTMGEKYSDFEFAKNQENDFLWDLVRVNEQEKLDKEKIRNALRNNNRIEFKVGGNKAHIKAAKLIKSLMNIEIHSGDRHATIGLSKRFDKIGEPEIAIKLDSDTNEVIGPNIDDESSSSKDGRLKSLARKFFS